MRRPQNALFWVSHSSSEYKYAFYKYTDTKTTKQTVHFLCNQSPVSYWVENPVINIAWRYDLETHGV